MGRIRYTQRSKKVRRGTRRTWSNSSKSFRPDTTYRLERLSEIEAFQVLKARLWIHQQVFDLIGRQSTEKE